MLQRLQLSRRILVAEHAPLREGIDQFDQDLVAVGRLRLPHLAQRAAAEAVDKVKVVNAHPGLTGGGDRGSHRPAAGLALLDAGGPGHRPGACLFDQAKIVHGRRLGGGRRLHPRECRPLLADELANELQRTGEAVARILGQGPCHHRPIPLGQLAKVGFVLRVLQHQLTEVLAEERQLAGQQFAVGDGQAVLIAEQADFALEAFGSGVQRRDGAELELGRVVAGQLGEAVDEAEVGHLDVITNKEKVARLDIEVLQTVFEVEQIEHLGRLAQVEQQVHAGHAGQARLLALGQQVVQAAVGQFHDDDQFAADVFNALQRKQKGMTQRLDVLEGPEFLFGTVEVVAEEVAVGTADELDGLVQAAGGLALPDLAEAAAAQGASNR